MKLKRRDFLRLTALVTASAAAGFYHTDKLLGVPASVKDVPVGQCRYCAIGCTTMAQVELDQDGKVMNVLGIKGDLNSSVNRGVLCTKAFYLHRALEYADRPKRPLIRREWINTETGKPDLANSPRVREGRTTKDAYGLKPSEEDMKENFVAVSWEDALEFITSSVEKSINEHGKFSVGYYGSGQAGTEETHIFNKTFKGGGMLANNTIEGQPRTCMASAVVGYLYAFGKDEPYGSLNDLDVPDPDFGKHADTYFLVGNNTAEAHPILFNRIAAVKNKNPDEVKVILADPRKTRSGTISDLWLPLASGRDLALLNSMTYVIATELDKAKYDVENGTVEAEWKYLDKEFIRRHVNFGIHEDVKMNWIKTEYGGVRESTWDLAYSNNPRQTYPDPKKVYESEEEVEKDLYKGFAIFLKFLEDYSPEKVADLIFDGESPQRYDRETRTWSKIGGEEAIRLAAKWFAEGYTTTTWCMGINQKLQGVWSNATLHMLHLITGKACKPGRHAFSFTGQPNACGGIRAPGALCHALPYGRLVANPVHRAHVEGIWKRRVENYLQAKGVSSSLIREEVDKIAVHPQPGPHTMEMFRRYAAGQIKVMFTSTVNPGASLPYAYPYRLACAAAHQGDPFPVTAVLEAYPNATTQVADIVFPASSWYEKEFSYGNLERRHQLIRKVLDFPGETLPDSVIFGMIIRRLEDKGLVPKGHVAQFWPEEYGDDWVQKTVEDSNKEGWMRKFTANIWEELQELTGGTGYDMTGMDREKLIERNWGYRQPFPKEYHTDADIKARYDKYESSIQYAYPYDPIVDNRTQGYINNLKKWNPQYASYIEKRLEEEKRDTDYHRKHNVPEGWYVSFYHANPFHHGMVDDPTQDGGRLFVVDGRATAWANPWWACKWDGKEFKKYDRVQITERRFNEEKIQENVTAPFDVVQSYEGSVIGNPDRDKNALLSIALSPGEFPGVRQAYRHNGNEIVIYDTREYNIGACTGRILEHWHTGSMTTRVRELARAAPGAFVEINSELAEELGISSGDRVIVEALRGQIELEARILDATRMTGGPRKDYVFIPFFDEKKLINMILPDRFDPFSFQMDYKMFAVKLRKGTMRETQAVPGKVI